MEEEKALIMKSELKILLVSDTHAEWPNFDKFRIWFQKNKPEYDLVILSGDYGETTFEFKDHDVEELTQKTEAQIQKTLAFFQELIQKTIIFIPGNHDIWKLYSKKEGSGDLLENIHAKSFEIQENLVVLGLGGAMKSIYKSPSGEFSLLYEEAPYTEERFTSDLFEVYNKAHRRHSHDVKFILLTHIGAFQSPTSVIDIERDLPNDFFQGLYYPGSKGITALLNENDRFLCHIHGHSHEGVGFQKGKSKTCSTINPGALLLAQFGELHLKRDKDSQWKIAAYNQHTLRE
jgi:Icc-related predicted phosphoesterase